MSRKRALVLCVCEEGALQGLIDSFYRHPGDGFHYSHFSRLNRLSASAFIPEFGHATHGTQRSPQCDWYWTCHLLQDKRHLNKHGKLCRAESDYLCVFGDHQFVVFRFVKPRRFRDAGNSQRLIIHCRGILDCKVHSHIHSVFYPLLKAHVFQVFGLWLHETQLLHQPKAVYPATTPFAGWGAWLYPVPDKLRARGFDCVLAILVVGAHVVVFVLLS